MQSPSVITLLNGYLLATDQGNPAFCSIHLVESEGGRMLFDCGHVGRRAALVSVLANRGLTPADIDCVVLSHSHWDHLQNADLFARVLLHPDELRFLSSPGIPSWTKAVLEGLDVQQTGEGDQLMPGVKVVELPGHTPGSIGLVVETSNGTAVLAGDAVPDAAVLRSRRASGHPTDQAKADASVVRVAALAELVYPGHDGPLRVDPAGEFQYAGDEAPLVFRGSSRVRSEGLP
jgi:N-acyl homoserine lactone hydrolase